VARLEALEADPHTVVGLGLPLLSRLGRSVDGLRTFPGDLPLFPSTQQAAWLFLAHADRGDAFDAGRAFARALGPALQVAEEVDAFQYRGGRDLSGFEDGTENPKGAAAEAAALIQGKGKGLDGGSFVAVQRWVHNLSAVEKMTGGALDAAIGRRRTTNEELADAPASAHVKRTAQESFDPPAFLLRRSMPFGGLREHGLYFVAYGESLDRFERQLQRMAGVEDGIVDGVTAFSRALTGGYYFCPPVHRGRLDLRGLR
jgi:porphyrinogen peroxidase